MQHQIGDTLFVKLGMNEEIIVDGSTVHINFESGAAHWKRALINTDRILAVDEGLWGRK